VGSPILQIFCEVIAVATVPTRMPKVYNELGF
jgi:hypothetical protein